VAAGSAGAEAVHAVKEDGLGADDLVGVLGF
jgi:hypothetical protein